MREYHANRRRLRSLAHCLIVAGATCVPGSVMAKSVQATVPGTAMPWVSTAQLNAAFAFGESDGSSPVAVPLRSVRAHAGDTIIVKYVSGTVTAQNGNYPYTDADGDTDFAANNGTGNGYGVFPSYYMTPYPIYLCELVGTFANKKGKIIGQPFAIADGPTTLTVPAGATSLQVGANDDKFSDNAGSWVISVKKGKK